MTDTSQLTTNVSCRLTLKNIPENFSNEQLIDLLDKKFDSKLKDIIITNLEHKYNSKNNKICLITADSLDLRKKVFSFFETFEMIDPRGFKQKINIVDCLYQNQPKDKSVKDSIEGTIEKINHFQKFKEFFEKGKIVDFKNEEPSFQEGIFDGVVEEAPPQKPEKKKESVKEKDKKHSKMIIMKKQVAESSVNYNDTKLDKLEAPVDKNLQTNFNKESGIEVITQEDKYQKDNYGKFNKKGKKDTYYKNDKKNSGYNNNTNEYYEEDYGKYKNYDKGYRGYDKNYDKGYDKNYNYDKGYDKTYDKGYDKGYDNGYDKGYNNKNYNNYDNYYDNGYNNGSEYNNSSYYKKDYRKGGYK